MVTCFHLACGQKEGMLETVELLQVGQALASHAVEQARDEDAAARRRVRPAAECVRVQTAQGSASHASGAVKRSPHPLFAAMPAMR
eukprot:357634-Chlamydomonas_euryale.AAC.3